MSIDSLPEPSSHHNEWIYTYSMNQTNPFIMSLHFIMSIVLIAAPRIYPCICAAEVAEI